MMAQERQQKIREWVQQQKHLKVSELSERLKVSEMTIHRDIQVLVKEGLVIKTFGGMTLAPEPQPIAAAAVHCVLCHRTVQERNSYRLILNNHQIESACCCHCGLIRHRQMEHQVVQALCYDFLTYTTISAETAWFVMGSVVDIQCCSPQVLPLGSRTVAERFVKGFEGEVFSLHEAMNCLIPGQGHCTK